MRCGIRWWAVPLLVVGAATSAAQSKLAATDFVFKSTGGNAGSDYNIWSNGFIGTFLTVDKPTTVTLQIRAAGSAAKQTWPMMGVHVGNRQFAIKVNRTAFTTYTVTCDLPAGTTLVRIEFSNDFYDPAAGQDRNLVVRDLTVSGPGVTIVNPSGANDTQTMVGKAVDSTIENYRKQDATLTVKDSAGKPLPNTSVRVKLSRHAFNFGTAVAGGWSSNDPLWPNPAAGSTAAQFQAALALNFNMVSLENAGKWALSEPTRGNVNLAYVDAIFDFASKHKMRARYHTLLWGDAQPDWVTKLETTALGSDPKAAAAAVLDLKQAIKARILYIAKDRGKRFIELDGINEASEGHQPVFLNIFGYTGTGDIYRSAISELRAGLSGAKVYFNDYNVLNYGPDYYAGWYLNFIRGVVDTGMTSTDKARLGVGIQYYNIGSIQHDPVRIYQSLANLGSLGMPISLTEFGVDSGSPGPAATILQDTLRLVFGTDQATTFNTWGFWSNAMWVNGAAFYDANWNLTPVGKIWQQMTGVKDWGLPGVPYWTTDVTLTTDANGKLKLRGFLGDYAVSAGLRKGSVALKLGTSAYDVTVK